MVNLVNKYIMLLFVPIQFEKMDKECWYFCDWLKIEFL